MPGAKTGEAVLTYNPLIYPERLPSVQTDSRDRESLILKAYRIL